MSFFCSRTCHLGCHITPSCHISVGSSWLWQFVRLTLFSMTSTVLRSTGQGFCRIPSVGISLILFSRSEVSGFGEEDHRGKVLFLPHSIKVLLTWFVTVDTDLDHLAEAVFVSFPYWKVTLFLSMLFLRRKNSVQPILRKWRVMLLLLEGGEFWEFFCVADLSLSPIY